MARRWYKPWTWFGRLAESADIYGSPVDWGRLFAWRGQPWALAPVWGPEMRQEKATTIRTLQGHTHARNLSRRLAEVNPNAAGLIERLTDYAVGKGSSTEVHGIDGEELPRRLVAQIEGRLALIRKANAWVELQEEMVSRLVTDGEWFLRIFPMDDGVTQVRFVEPAQVQPPQDADHDGPWSYGILSAEGDTATPVAYNLRDPLTGQDERVEAHFIVHAKMARRNQKRGIPLLYACEDDLEGTARLRHATREGEKARAAVSYFREWESVSREAIRAIQDERYTDSYTRTTSTGEEREVRVERVEPGAVIDVPKGMQVKPPPSSPNSDAAGAAVQQGLEAVAARFGLASWCVTGSSDASNFAASLTAESPMTKSIERLQGRLARWVDDAETRCLEIAVEQDLLPQDTLERVDLLVSFPSPAARAKKEETDRRKVLRDNNILSEATWRAEEGYDDAELEQIKKERADGVALLPSRVTATATNPETPSGTPAARYAQETGR